MQFLFPGFLWALLVLVLPIIIHLFYFRRFKKVYFTNVRFLKELKEETSATNKIKNWLVLLSRLLALAMLVFAFAQPILTHNKKLIKGNKAVSIFVDNSFSMSALSKDVPLIEKAKSKAREIIAAYSAEDEIQIFTHENFAKDERKLSVSDALLRIDEIQTTPEVSNLSSVVNKQLQSFDANDPKKSVFILSDFQKSISDFTIIPDTAVSYYLLPFQSVRENNVSIDSVWLSAPVAMLNQNNTLIVKLKNYNDEDAEEVQMSLRYENQTRPLGNIRVPENGEVIDSIQIFIKNTGWQRATVQITDYPIQFDDAYNISFEVDSELKVLAVNEQLPNKYLTAAFKGLDFFQLSNQYKSKLNYSEFNEYDLIILNDIVSSSSGLNVALQQYVKEGGNLLVFLSPSSNIENINGLLSTLETNTIQRLTLDAKRVSSINTEEFVFNDVFDTFKKDMTLPSVKSSFVFNKFQKRSQEDLLKFRDGSAFLSKYTQGDGYIYVCASALDVNAGDLAQNAEIFIPMIYKMGLSQAKREKLAYTIGQSNIIETQDIRQGSESLFKIKGEQEFIPGHINFGNKVLLDVKDQIKQSGFYALNLEEKQIGSLAFNFDRRESDLSYYSAIELADTYGANAEVIDNLDSNDLTAYIGRMDKGIPLWKWCIIGVLVFLALETLLLRLWKT